MSKKQSSKGQILSAVVGATFFAIPYLGLGVSIIPSLGLGALAFGAGSLMFSSGSQTNQETLNSEKVFFAMIDTAKKQNAQIYAMISKVEKGSLQDDIKEVHSYAKKIIDAVAKEPNKLNHAHSFFDYYLPRTLTILNKYDVIENQALEAEEIKKFMASTEKMIAKIKESFKSQLANLYQVDMLDTDAEMKVFESMLKSEGFTDTDDFNIK